MTIKLKPCPFCGSEDIYKTHSEEIPFGTKNPEIFCNTCKAIFAVEDDSPYLNCDEDFKYRREKTAEAWNKRAELPSAQTTLNDLISRKAAIEAVEKAATKECARCVIQELPQASVVHAHWIEDDDEMACSNCGKIWNYCDNDTHTFNYCPNCGAKMDEVSE